MGLLQLAKTIEKEKERRDGIFTDKNAQEQLLEQVKKEVMEYEEKEAQLIRIIKNVSFSILRSSLNPLM